VLNASARSVKRKSTRQNSRKSQSVTTAPRRRSPNVWQPRSKEGKKRSWRRSKRPSAANKRKRQQGRGRSKSAAKLTNWQSSSTKPNRKLCESSSRLSVPNAVFSSSKKSVAESARKKNSSKTSSL